MTITLLTGDVRDVLPTLPANSVQTVVTSPPYYSLRDYGTATWDGGDAACDHTQRMARGDSGRCSDDTRQGINPAPVVTAMQYRQECAKCGARRIDRQLGLEPTPDAYIAAMVAVFREIRRVMRDDAVAFVNMGDSFSGKQLLMMPARLALALQADGWWLRSDIIWAKPNPMPESVRDRPVNSYEHVFLLAKSARYFYDAIAIAEPISGGQPQEAPFPAAHFATFPPALAERCTILDPFSGAGTALLVADRLGRNAIGIDLSHSYMEMARARLVDDCPLFADIDNTAPPTVGDGAYDRDMRDLFAWAAD